jgi:deoxyribonuclease-4
MSPNVRKAAERAKQIGCDTIQLFVSNPTGWRTVSDDPAGCMAFAQAMRDYELNPIVIHAPYLINLASPDDMVWEKSIHLLRWTMQRSSLIDAKYIVFHTGSHRGSGIEPGIARLAQGIERVLGENSSKTLLLLENDVGAGDSLGNKFEHLGEMLNILQRHSEHIGVCLDTAHLWGAGYDISNVASTQHVLRHFDAVIGLSRLKVIHLNDTKVTFDSHRDVHTRIGEGIIPSEGLQTLLCDPHLDRCAVLLETPVMNGSDGKEDWEHEKRHLERARSLITRQYNDLTPGEISFSTNSVGTNKERVVQQLLW